LQPKFYLSVISQFTEVFPVVEPGFRLGAVDVLVILELTCYPVEGVGDQNMLLQQRIAIAEPEQELDKILNL